jgi:broad specificity phosphatase PhoE
MTSLVLVRHAMPAYSENVPADEWVLSDDGRAAAERLCAGLPAGALLAASEEPKAWQTLEPAGDVVRDRRLGEVYRANEPWDGPFRALRQAYVEGVDHAGWEPRSTVVERFDAAVTEFLVRAGGGPVIVASHGMAMTVWLSARIGLAHPGAFWAALQFPDAIEVHLGHRTATRRSVSSNPLT